jgi:hypothetical protein
MTPASPSQPALGQSIGRLVVDQGVAFQEAAQGLGMGWVAQPDEGFDVQLTGSFAAETQGGSDLTVGSRWCAVQSIAGDHHIAETAW